MRVCGHRGMQEMLETPQERCHEQDKDSMDPVADGHGGGDHCGSDRLRWRRWRRWWWGARDGVRDPATGNMEAAAHEAVAAPSGWATSVAQIAGGTGSTPLGLGSPTVRSRVLGTLLGAAQRDRCGAAATVRPLTLYPYPAVASAVAGTVTMAIDDRDNSGSETIGDVVTFAFDRCQETAREVIDGSVAVELSRLEATSVGGRMTMSRLSTAATDGRHAITIDGTLRLEYAETSAWTDWMRTTAEGEVTVTLHTHRFDDTVVMLPGYFQESTYDSMRQQGSSQFNGTFRSAAVGGLLQAETDPPFVDRESDEYPMSGGLKVKGQTGAMIVRSLSASDVRIELDHNDCGTAEVMQTESWDWLI